MNLPQCRVCLESDNEKMCAPCKCRGSSKFIHTKCLTEMRMSNLLFRDKCTVCFDSYVVKDDVSPIIQRWLPLVIICWCFFFTILLAGVVQLVVLGVDSYFCKENIG
jgi:E3 ubiquitin-protein ligase DOA10